MIAALIPVLGTVIDKLFPDASASAEAKLKLFDMQQAGEFKALDADLQMALGQIETNKAEAQSSSLFVSGWRPAVGWVCVLALMWVFLLHPALTWGLAIAGHPMTLPNPAEDHLFELLTGLLGLGGFRTFEKVRGVASK